MKTANMSNTLPARPPNRKLKFSMFSLIFSDNITALKYAFIGFKKKNHHFLVYIHCLYIDKWPNSMYIFYNHFSLFFALNKFTLISTNSKGHPDLILGDTSNVRRD